MSPDGAVLGCSDLRASTRTAMEVSSQRCMVWPSALTRSKWDLVGTDGRFQPTNRHRFLVPDLPANNFARNDDFNAPVFLASCARIVIRNRHGLPESHRRYAIRPQPLRNEEIANGVPALLRETLVEVVAASAVSVTFHL